MSFTAWFLMGIAIGGVIFLVSAGCYMFTLHIRFKSAIATLNSNGLTAHRYQANHNDAQVEEALEFIAKRGFIVADTKHDPVGQVAAHHKNVPGYKLRFERAS